MTKEARETKELIQETKETTRDEGGDEDEAKMMTTRWRRRRTIGMTEEMIGTTEETIGTTEETIGTTEETKRRRRETIETMGKRRR